MLKEKKRELKQSNLNHNKSCENIICEIDGKKNKVLNSNIFNDMR